MKKTKIDGQLLAVVNSPLWDIFIEYKRQQLAIYHEQLEWMADKAMLQTQGRVAEIKEDLKLKDKILGMHK